MTVADQLVQLEREVARLRQRSDDHDHDIRAFGPLVTEHAKLAERLDHLQQAISQLRDQHVEDHRGARNALEVERERVDQEFDDRDERDRTRVEESKRFRTSTYISWATIGVGLIGAVGAYLTLLAGH